MSKECELCVDAIRIIVESTRPTLGQIEDLIKGIETAGSLLECDRTREECLPLKLLQRLKTKAKGEIVD